MPTKTLFFLFIGLLFLNGGAYGQQRTVKTPPKVTIKGTGNTSVSTFSDGTLTSSLLGLTLSVPVDFSTISLAEAQVLDEAAKNIMFKDGEGKKEVEKAISRTIKVGIFTHKPYGEPNNSAIEIAAVRQGKGVTAKIALAANVALMKNSNYTLTRSFPPTKIGANTFSIAEFEGTFAGIELTQRMYVIMNRGYSILIASTYLNEEQMEINERVIATLKLN